MNYSKSKTKGIMYDFYCYTWYIDLKINKENIVYQQLNYRNQERFSIKNGSTASLYL